MSAATISIVLDIRRVKKSNKYPVKLRVTFERATEYYQTIFDLLKDDYDKLAASRISNELQNIRDKLKRVERMAENAASDLTSFSFDDFEKDFISGNQLFRQRKTKPGQTVESNNEFDFSPYYKKFPVLELAPSKPNTIASCYSVYIKNLLIEGRISTAMYYHCSYRSINKFRGNVSLENITVSFLREYESWMTAKDVSKTTIGMYLRPLRTIFNEADNDGIIKKEKYYPFGKRKFVIPASKNIKKALDLKDMEKIYFYQCDPKIENEQLAKDYWLFSYFANGMNPKDIACLKYRNINDEYLVFERSKTQRALRNDPKPITVYVNDDMKAIIERRGNKDKSASNYIFPIMEPGMSPLRQYDIIQLFVSLVNSWMKNILKNLGINKNATTYVARHTFSTVMKRSGASTEYIQEALGHSNIKTTENYLDSFDKEVKKEFSQRLTSFKTSND